MLRRAVLCLGLLSVLSVGCSPSKSTKTDAGEPDAGFDAGEPDAGFDAGPMCSFTVHQGQGLPCNLDADCTTGRCYVPLTGGGYCTTTCNPSSPNCASGYTCNLAVDRGDNVCELASGTTPPAHAPLAFGSPCGTDTDCAGDGAFCDSVLGSDGLPYTFCTNFCDPSAANPCGECGLCAPPPQGGSPECLPRGSKAIGDQCDQNSDCSTFYCRGFCTILCSDGSSDPIECPDGTICRNLESGGQFFGLCMYPSQIQGTQAGGPCTFDLECAPDTTCHITPGALHGTCQPGTGLGATCAMDSDCATGLVCRPIAPGLRHTGQSPEPDALACTHDCTTPCGSSAACVALDLDTRLQFFRDQGGTPTEVTLPGTAFDINPTFGNRWSAFTQTLAAGTYWVEVKAYSGAFGQYVLELTDGVHAAGQTAEAPGNNSTTASAQSITVPTRVAGTFSGPGDFDFYTFTLQTETTVTIKTSRGEGSACLPTSMIGQVPWGDPCTTDYQCASGLCEQSIQVCGQPCTLNSECGGIDPPPDAGTPAAGDLDAGDPDAGVVDPDAGPGVDAGPVDGGDAGTNPEPYDAGPPMPICADFLTHHSCVKADAHKQLPTGSDCHYSFECERDYCAWVNNSAFCTQRCSGPTARCGIGMTTNQCLLLTEAPSGEAISDYACVPAH